MSEVYNLHGDRVVTVEGRNARDTQGNKLAVLNGVAVQVAGEAIAFVYENTVTDKHGDLVLTIEDGEVVDVQGHTIAVVEGEDLHIKGFGAAVYFYCLDEDAM